MDLTNREDRDPQRIAVGEKVHSQRAILVVEDDHDYAFLVGAMLEHASPGEFETTHVDRLADARAHVLQSRPDCILLDLCLPDARHLESLADLRALAPNVPMVILSGRDDKILAITAMQEGVQDYLVKSRVDGHVLQRVVRYAIERKQAEQKADRAKDEFLATVSHELRTPLTSIKGYTELLLSSLVQEGLEEERGLLEVINRNTGRLERLVQDVLFVARLGATEFDFQARPLDLSELTAGCVRAARPKASQKQIELTFEGVEVVELRGDQDRLAQLIDNLISNALKYTPRGGRVDVQVHGEGRRAVVRVKDSGIGIPPEEQEQVFDRFFRGTSAEDNVIPGVGLGLTIAKAIAEAHGGKITVESAEGAGSIFAVELPSDRDLNEIVTEGAPRNELAAPTGAPQGSQRLAGVDRQEQRLPLLGRQAAGQVRGKRTRRQPDIDQGV